MAAAAVPGEALGAFGLTEPGGGSDAGATRTRPRSTDGTWVINGGEGVHHQRGHRHHRAWSRSPRSPASRPDGSKEISAILVPSGTPGFTRRAEVLQGRLARLGHPRAVVRRLPGAGGEPARRARPRLRAVPVDPRRGPHRDRRARRRARPGLRRRVGRSTRASARRSAGRSASNQAIAFKIADMEVRAHTARLAYYDAAARMLAGEPFKRQAAIAKLYASEIAVDNAREATQVHGGYGFMNEYPVGPVLARLEDPRDRRGHQRGAAHADRPRPRPPRRLTVASQPAVHLNGVRERHPGLRGALNGHRYSDARPPSALQRNPT